ERAYGGRNVHRNVRERELAAGDGSAKNVISIGGGSQHIGLHVKGIATGRIEDHAVVASRRSGGAPGVSHGWIAAYVCAYAGDGKSRRLHDAGDGRIGGQ